MTKFTIALREIGTYKEVLRSQVITFCCFCDLHVKSFLQANWFGFFFMLFQSQNLGAVPECELNQFEKLVSYVGLAMNSLSKHPHHFHLLNLLPLIGYLVDGTQLYICYGSYVVASVVNCLSYIKCIKFCIPFIF